MAKRIELKGERRVTSNLAAFRRPAWSPDGRLVVESDGRRPSLYLLDGKGRIETRLGEGCEAAWAPDGARLAFTRVGGDGRREVWVCDVAAPDDAARLAGGDGAVWEHPTWSPDGTELACASDHGNPGGLRHIWALDAAHGARRRLTCDPQRSDGHPAWSPDGRALAFDGDDRADDAREIDAYVLDLPTGGLSRLSDGTVPTRRPVFIDRRYLVAERRSVAGPTLVVLDRHKRRTLPVGDAPAGEREPAARVVGKARARRVLIAFVRRDEKLARDTVWIAELRGPKVVDEAEARRAELAEARERAEAAGIPGVPPPVVADEEAGVFDETPGPRDGEEELPGWDGADEEKDT